MELIKKWFQSSSPFMKMLMAISITSGAVVLHRTMYAPYVKRQKFRQAEDWANMIIEQEESGEGGTNNISY